MYITTDEAGAFSDAVLFERVFLGRRSVEELSLFNELLNGDVALKVHDICLICPEKT